MAWRGLHISRPCRLSLSDNQCVIAGDADVTRLAIEDIAWIVLDTPQAVLTTALLAACMESGVALILTDARHHPSGLVLPFHRHYRQAAVSERQITLDEGLRKRFWQAILRAKIRSQAAVLVASGCNASPLLAMAERVKPGDPENVEAHAAKNYWPNLFAGFARNNGEDLRNAMLDYGYAVMRAAVARGLVAAGLLPSVGVHHANALNPFNLADDVIEPFRPIVDHLVWRLSDQGRTCKGALTIGYRRSLAAVLLETIRFGHDRVSALVATELVAVALARAMEDRNVNGLVLPLPDIA